MKLQRPANLLLIPVLLLMAGCHEKVMPVLATVAKKNNTIYPARKVAVCCESNIPNRFAPAFEVKNKSLKTHYQ